MSSSRFASFGSILTFTLAVLAAPACAVASDAESVEPQPEDVGSVSVALERQPEDVGASVALERPPATLSIRRPDVTLSADLALEGRMRFYSYATGTIGVQVDITNVGNMSVTAEALRVRIDGTSVTAALWTYGGSASAPENFHTITPGGRGYLLATLPAGLGYCRTYGVAIDLDRTAQWGLRADPFLNDAADVITPCLRWTTPLDTFALDGQPPSALVAGKSLQSIVSSIEVGRSDGKRCSFCHYAGSGRSYSPNVAHDRWALIGPNDLISGRRWTGIGGWADRFNAQTALKPFELRRALQTWKRHGALVGLDTAGAVVSTRTRLAQ